MDDVLSGNWNFTTAKSNAVILAPSGSTQRIKVHAVEITCAKSNTGDVSVDMGFSSTGSLPAITPNSLTPRMGIVHSHGGIAPGGGAESHRVVLGGWGESLLITCSPATGGDVRPSVTYQLIDQ
jgi:hypothetical protein